MDLRNSLLKIIADCKKVAAPCENLGDVSIHLYKGESKGNYVYFVVGDADELFEFQRSNGVEVEHIGPPLKIERVNVPLRLEKRLAALIKDLAGHKGMSMDSFFEETLLHTFEVVGNNTGVASPHTKKTHQLIQELKKKHGIDYDTHASYRFVE